MRHKAALLALLPLFAAALAGCMGPMSGGATEHCPHVFIAGAGWNYHDRNNDGHNDTVSYSLSLRNKEGVTASTAWWNLSLEGPSGAVNQTTAGPTTVSGTHQSVAWNAELGLDPGDPAGAYVSHVWVSEAGSDRCELSTIEHELAPP